MKRTLFLGGGHRGGTSFTRAALRQPDAYMEIIVSDPKPGRALGLAKAWRDAGVSAEGLQEPCEKAVKEVEADSIILSIDDVSPMGTVLSESALPSQWQLLARGIGSSSPVIALSGTILEGDYESRAGSVRLIKELASFVEPQSSIGIRANPLNSVLLESMRERVSAHSARRVQVLDRQPTDLTGGTLNLIWGDIAYPMLVQEKPQSQRWSETKERVLEAELPAVLRDAAAFAIASVGHRNVDFFIANSARGKRFIIFHLPLVHALPTQEETDKFRRIRKKAASVLNLERAVTTSMLAAPMVTD